jgi:hypothetical protein
LAVVAPWLDISKEIQVRGCFGFVHVSGRLCIRTESRQLSQEVEGDFAVIKTQQTEDVNAFGDRFQKSTLRPGTEISISSDGCSIVSDVMLASADQHNYKLLQRVSSKSFSRLIDPSRAMLKIAQSPLPLSCPHPETTTMSLPQSTSYQVAMYSFDEILGFWSSGQMRAVPQDPTTNDGSRSHHLKERDINRRILAISHGLNSYTKYNIALALSTENVVAINHANACTACCIDHLLRMAPDNGLNGVRKDRWLINTARQLQNVQMSFETKIDMNSRRRIKMK